jgi:hypothetical protein
MTWCAVLVGHAVLVLTGILGSGFGRFHGWESRKVEELVRQQGQQGRMTAGR